MDSNELAQVLSKYLDEKHASTWPPMVWEIAKQDRKRLATIWFIRVCEDLGLVTQPVEERPLPPPHWTDVTTHYRGDDLSMMSLDELAGIVFTMRKEAPTIYMDYCHATRQFAALQHAVNFELWVEQTPLYCAIMQKLRSVPNGETDHVTEPPRKS